MERLKIAEGKRYFETESGVPFIWIADTAWTIPQRMKWDDVEYYMQTRKRQGFTVLQIVALDPERDVQMRNPAGEPALIDGDLSRPNEYYFRYLDRILDMAEQYGFYVLLLPVWGQLVVGEDWSGGTYEKTVTEENAYGYGKWIGERYGSRPNVLWCLGGDRQPIHRQKADYRNVWRRMAEGLLMGCTGADAAYNEKNPVWEQVLITYHACYEQETGECSTMSYWTDDEAWIRFIMLQSGHGKASKNYELVKKEYDREITLPVWDGEPGYEAMPTCWPVKDMDSFHGTEIVRKRAYWSLLSGAFGYTYGHASVWCSVSEKERNAISFVDWFDAIHSEGSAQIAYIRAFLEDMKVYRCRPCQEILLEQTPETDTVETHISAAFALDGEALCVYFPNGGGETLDVRLFEEGREVFYGWWYNPRDGKFYIPDSPAAQGDTEAVSVEYQAEGGRLKVTAPEAGTDRDWLLILLKEPSAQPPVTQKKYAEDTAQEAAKKVFEW